MAPPQKNTTKKNVQKSTTLHSPPKLEAITLPSRLTASSQNPKEWKKCTCPGHAGLAVRRIFHQTSPEQKKVLTKKTVSFPQTNSQPQHPQSSKRPAPRAPRRGAPDPFPPLHAPCCHVISSCSAVCPCFSVPQRSSSGSDSMFRFRQPCPLPLPPWDPGFPQHRYRHTESNGSGNGSGMGAHVRKKHTVAAASRR